MKEARKGRKTEREIKGIGRNDRQKDLKEMEEGSDEVEKDTRIV